MLKRRQERANTSGLPTIFTPSAVKLNVRPEKPTPELSTPPISAVRFSFSLSGPTPTLFLYSPPLPNRRHRRAGLHNIISLARFDVNGYDWEPIEGTVD